MTQTRAWVCACALANKLRSYIPKPVVDQVEAGQTAWARRAGAGTRGTRKRISTMFCKIVGVDYTTENGERAVEELGALVMQIQGIVQPLDATMTRVSCDDKGTSAVILCDVPSKAVTAALRIVEAVGQHGPRFSRRWGSRLEGLARDGGGDTQADTVHNSCVTFAARLDLPAHTGPGGVLCDDATRRACEHSFCRRADEVQSYEDEIVVYMPVAARGAEDGIVEPALAALSPPSRRRFCASAPSSPWAAAVSRPRATSRRLRRRCGGRRRVHNRRELGSCQLAALGASCRSRCLPAPRERPRPCTASAAARRWRRRRRADLRRGARLPPPRGGGVRGAAVRRRRARHSVAAAGQRGPAVDAPGVQQLRYAEVAQDWEKCDQFTEVLQWFDVLVGLTPAHKAEPELESGA